MVMLLALSTSVFAEDVAVQDPTVPVETAVATVEPQSTEDSSVSISSTQSQDDLLLSGEPLAYGDEAFRQRILQRTGGKRPAIGLVLSGGSARAMAHIGVLKYLEEQGIVPDYIVSNSMGSIVGLLYAAGMSPGQIERCISTMDLSKVISFTLPLEGGLLKADSLASYAVSLLNGSNTKSLRLEDLSIPIIVVQEDLVTKRQILVSEGDFATILRASFAIPVYFPSVEYQGIC
jgi:NTE family protein